MRSVFEASNSVEAHMILNLLEQEGISGRVDGEYLQGGVGELQAIGVVRVVVPDDQFARAKAIVDKWESTQPPEPVEPVQKKSHRFIQGFGLGGALGVGLMVLVYSTPVTEDGIDYDGDSKLDEVWIYNNHRMHRAEIDRNLDSQIDLVYQYDQKGLVARAEADDNFDGRFETKMTFRNGNAVTEARDVDDDGEIDVVYRYRFGVVWQMSLIDPETALPRKVQTFENGSPVSAQIDTDGDGKLDKEVRYDRFEDVIDSVELD